MKNLIYSIVATLLLFTTACRPDKCCAPPPHSQLYITAEKNGTGWSADPGSSTIHGDTVAIFGTNFNPSIEETLTMQFKVSGTGNYALKNTQAVYYNTLGRDVITSEYHLDDSFANSVNVMSCDKNTNIITGNFNLKLKHVYPDSAHTSNYTIQFLRGSFAVWLNK